MSNLNVRNLYPHKEVNTERSAATTDVELVPAVAGLIAVVDKMLVSTDSSGNFFLESSTTTKILGKVYLAKDGGIVLDEFNIRSAKGESITVTDTFAAGNRTYYVEYHYEG